MMNPPQAFVDSLSYFDPTTLGGETKRDLREYYLRDPCFTYDKMINKSRTAGHLANWVLNAVKYINMYDDIRPTVMQYQTA